MADIRTRIKHWWLEKSTQSHSPAPRVSQDVLHLFRLRREHRLLRLRFNGIGQEYQSLLLEVDLKNNRLLLDEPFPPLAESRMLGGLKVEVASIEGAASTRFETRVQGVLVQRGMAALAVAVPDSVVAFQRRNHYRLSVQDHMPVQAVLRHESLGNVAAQVVDLSSQGIRLLVPQLDAQGPLQTAPLFLRLADERGMLCTLRVCSQQPAADHENSILGGQLVGLNQPQTQLIERFIVRSQRVQRQREMALES